MTGILRQIDKARQKIKKGVADKLLMQKPYAEGMYRFSMFMIDYYARVRENLKMDYDSFMIVQTVVSHTLYQIKLQKNPNTDYAFLETAWDKIINRDLDLLHNILAYKLNKETKLTISSICLITKLPKETVRRKINQLCANNLLKISKREGISLGTNYKKVFQDFVPVTTLEVSKLIKSWEKSGVLKSLLSFRV